MDGTPKLTVIKNEEVISDKTWLSFPATVDAKSPENPDKICKFRVSKLDLAKQAEATRRAPIYDFWSNVIGIPPPVFAKTDTHCEGLSCLVEAHACWKGIKRPCGEDDDGAEYLIYALKPKGTYKFASKPPLTFAEYVDLPEDVIFSVLARLDNPATGDIRGVLIGWQFIETDPDDRMLPYKHETRYAKRLW